MKPETANFIASLSAQGWEIKISRDDGYITTVAVSKDQWEMSGWGSNIDTACVGIVREARKFLDFAEDVTHA